MSVSAAEAVANAVLYEGYVLYPYRASAPKNRMRWQVGLVVPRSFAEATAADPWFAQTECVAEAQSDATMTIRVRGLHVQQRCIDRAIDDGRAWEAVPSLEVEGRQLIEWDEAVVVESTIGPITLDMPATRYQAWPIDGFVGEEPVMDRLGRAAARVVRRRQPITAAIRIETTRHGPFVKIRIRVENDTPTRATTLAHRDDAVREALAGVHVILAITEGGFVSLLDPPPSAAALVASCRNEHTFPVLAGAPGSRAVLLSSPIILYDYPSVAPESAGDLFDATEIDELLTLRVRTMTDEEKREARATDPRAAEVIDRCDSATADALRGLHGAVRQFADTSAPQSGWEAFLNPADQPPPEETVIEAGGFTLARGVRVVLRPGRRADSMDICLRGRRATVAAVYRTLENTPYVAVTLDDDPFGAAGEKYRRSLFFHPDELEPLADNGGPQ
ncbi:MAG TPA: hypothetical protein VEC39_03475 [Vicinamibacterales bacterium]|nr:hypothetical protein [Vicinamibacterales bacterium]